MNEKITLGINGADYQFDVSREAYSKYINSIKPDSKIAPSHNFLTTTVNKAQKEQLSELLKNPANTMAIASELIEAYTPDLDIVVKK